MTINNFMNKDLNTSIEEIFAQINAYIFEQKNVDLNHVYHVYIDGTKICANANKYSWVWKKSSVKNGEKTFGRITALLEEMNAVILPLGVKFGIREEYAIEYLEQIREQYVSLTGVQPENVKRGRGHRKTVEQRHYEKLGEYIERLKNMRNRSESAAKTETAIPRRTMAPHLCG